MMLTKDQYEKATVLFTEYFVKNYPGPNTIISSPTWHAPKILRAAAACLEEALLTVPVDRQCACEIGFCRKSNLTSQEHCRVDRLSFTAQNASEGGK